MAFLNIQQITSTQFRSVQCRRLLKMHASGMALRVCLLWPLYFVYYGLKSLSIMALKACLLYSSFKSLHSIFENQLSLDNIINGCMYMHMDVL